MKKTLAAVTATAALLLALTGCTLPLEAAQGGLLDKPSSADDAAAKADVANAKVAFIAYSVNSGGTIATSAAELASSGYVASPGVDPVIIKATSASDFCIQATSSSGAVFHSEAAGGVVDGACP